MQQGSIKKTIIIFIVFLLVVFTAGYAMANHYFNQLSIDRHQIDHAVIETEIATEATSAAETEAAQPEALTKTFLLIGTDKSEHLTDSMLAVHIDFSSKTVSLFSVPRDYKINLSEKVQQLINYHVDYIKLTELHSYAKSADYESPASLTAKAIEEVVGFHFDHIVLFNLEAFKEVVDAVGGVDVYVPINMKYHDPTQNLTINLQPGLQTLDGEMAEGFVRYRQNNRGQGYGDFGRMEMQQYFLKEFVKKLVSVQSALNFNEIFDAIKDFVQTDASLNDALYLLSRANELDFDRVYAHTLPGSNRKIHGKYFLVPPKMTKLHQIVHDQIELDKQPTTLNKRVEITILNGAGRRKMASKYQDILVEAGYNVVSIGDYYDEKALKTRIYVPNETVGQDLQHYFNLSELIVDDSTDGITIVLGRLTE